MRYAEPHSCRRPTRPSPHRYYSGTRLPLRRENIARRQDASYLRLARPRRVAPMLEIAAIVPEEQRLLLSSLSPGPAQKRLALAVVLGISGRLCLDHRRAAFGRADETDRRLPPGLSDCDVRVRFDHRDPPVRPVFNSALARHPRDRECISLHGAYPDPVCPDVSRRVCAHGPDWRAAEFGMDLRSVALWFSPVRHRLCPFKGWESQQSIFEGHAACGDRPERRLDGGPRFGSGICLHSGRTHYCPASCSIPPVSARSGPILSGRPSRWQVFPPSSCSGSAGARCSIFG